MDDIAYKGRLYDFYGELLSPRHREIFSYSVERDMSLSEIAEETGLSRQGVHAALQKAEVALREYEEKLGLVARFERLSAKLDRLQRIVDEIKEEL